MKIADNYGNIAATLKQIEADKVKARSKPAEPETKPKPELGQPPAWATAVYTIGDPSHTHGDFDPA